MANIVKRPKLLTQTSVEVRAEHDLVVLKVGNAEMKMPYEAAFKLSQWLRVRAKGAKKNAGDTGRHWSAVGVLTDLNSRSLKN